MAVQRRPTSANQRLRDEGISHAIQLERLKNAEQRAIVQFVEDELIPDLITRLEVRLTRIEQRGLDLGPETTARLNRLIQQLQEAVEAWSTGLAAKIVNRIGEIADVEARWAIATLVDVTEGLPVTVSTVMPSIEQLSALALSRPIDGVVIEKLLERLSINTRDMVEKQVRLGVASGQTTPQIMRRVRDSAGLAQDAAIVITRTAVAQAATVARDAVYLENADLIRGIQWVSTLDTRTCPVCAPLDGKVFKHGTGPRSPLHPQCRCSTVPVLKSWSELGLDARTIGPGTRASLDGQVSGSITYADWLRTRSVEEQEEVLGVTRAKLFRSGKLQLSDFANNSNELMTIAELRKRYASAFNKAGL